LLLAFVVGVALGSRQPVAVEVGEGGEPSSFVVATPPPKGFQDKHAVSDPMIDQSGTCVEIHAHAIHGSISDDLMFRNGSLNFLTHREFRCDSGSPVEGQPLKGGPGKLEALAVLFATREPHGDRVLVGSKVPKVEAVATAACHTAIMYAAAETKDKEFPVDKFVGYDTPGHAGLNVYGETCAVMSFTGQQFYLVVEHTLARFAQDDHGNRWEVGVVPSEGDGKTPPFLCQLYMNPYGQNRNPGDRGVQKPFLIEGKPVYVIFTWPAANNVIAYSNVCFEENLFWSTDAYDIDAHDASKQPATQAPPEDITPGRWPPVFFAPERVGP